MEQKCIRCGAENITPGKLQSSGRLSFYPDHAKFMTLKTSTVSIGARLCLECGHVELVGDFEKARELTAKKNAD